MLIRRTSDALRADPFVDRSREIAVFHHPSGFAWIIVKPLAFPGGLNPALIHLKQETVAPFFDK